MKATLHTVILNSNRTTVSQASAKCSNAFVERLILSDVQISILWVSFMILIPLTISVNFVLAYALFKTRQLKSTFVKYIFILSISDCFVGAIGFPLTVLLFSVYSRERSCNVEIAAIFTVCFYHFLSGHVIILIALHRYLKLGWAVEKLNHFERWLVSNLHPSTWLDLVFSGH